MADLGGYHGRNYRPSPYAHHPPPFQRDAAFSDVFGEAPGPGRSHTMTSQPSRLPYDSARTMTSMPHPHMVRGPPQPTRQLPNGYVPAPNGTYHAYQGAATMGSAHPPQLVPRPQRSAYPPPQRLDSRPSASPHYPEPNGYMRPAGPALNSDAYRSKSMARMGHPLAYHPPPNAFNHTSASAFRHQQYQPSAPTTLLGRVVPERHPNERSMSMTSYSGDRDIPRPPPGAGRMIPGRRPQPVVEQPVVPVIRESADNHANVPNGVGRSRPPSESSMSTRTMSMASTTLVEMPSNSQSQITAGKSGSQSSSVAHRASRRSRGPLVYPALLSRVADVFRERIQVGERQKNGLSYQNAFSGAEAVDLIAYIVKTNDRNLALLLGRALDAQKFFHDVTYDHRLRDAPAEIYQFKETIGEETPSSEVNGVFTLLTECYSPTCTRDNLCYSIACPRRLEQQARLNLKPQPILRSSASKGSLKADDDDDDNQKLWINMVPKEVSDGIDDREKKRQEIIFEIMYTERDFVKDLEYLRDFWMRPLRSNNNTTHSPIPEHRREKFVRVVFGNCLEVLKVNSALCESLNTRQKESHVVHTVGDIFLHHAPRFDPFIKYGANQLYGRYEFEKEKANNEAFANFVEETERLKESRKLELNGYLTKPTTRLARYPLLLGQVLKYTKEDSPDREDIPNAIGLIRDFLSRVNDESGKSENHFNLVHLNSSLRFNPGEYVDLRLTEENRQLLSKMTFKKTPTDSSEVTAYLFDHAILLVRIKVVNKREEFRVYRKPIPLELLVITQMDEVIPRLGLPKRPSASLLPGNNPNAKEFPITFRHLGKGGYEQTLYATSTTQRKKFIELVEAQQRKLRERNSNFYNKNILCTNFFSASNRVNCLVPVGMFFFFFFFFFLGQVLLLTLVQRRWQEIGLWYR